jgi:hypothetical protein
MSHATCLYVLQAVLMLVGRMLWLHSQLDKLCSIHRCK